MKLWGVKAYIQRLSITLVDRQQEQECNKFRFNLVMFMKIHFLSLFQTNKIRNVHRYLPPSSNFLCIFGPPLP